MTDLEIDELSSVDPDDISGVLLKIEKSFSFKFGATELKDLKTFGQLCDIIASKVKGDNINDCTTQQAFYKVRNAIVDTLCVDKNDVAPKTNLQALFPRQTRRRQIVAIEKRLGFKTKILRPKHWIMTIFVIIFLISLIGLFIFWKVGAFGLIISIIGLKLIGKFGIEFDLQTVGQIAEKISREQYLKSRRDSTTINRTEIEQKVKELFRHDLYLDDNALTRQATFV